jgi:hypothetical protein
VVFTLDRAAQREVATLFGASQVTSLMGAELGDELGMLGGAGTIRQRDFGSPELRPGGSIHVESESSEITDVHLVKMTRHLVGVDSRVLEDWRLLPATIFYEPGDFDGNGELECADLDILVQEVAGNDPHWVFDLDGDGQVNTSDRDQWLAIAGAHNHVGGPYRLGDANLDGRVDVSDLNAWNANKYTSQASWCAGDFNADGVVDVSDFNIWNGSKFQSSASQLVPEPTTASLLTLPLLVVAALRRQRYVGASGCERRSSAKNR